MIVRTFVPTGPIVIGGDDTLARRRGKKIHANAWYAKTRPTFAAAIAIVRRAVWSADHFAMSEAHTEMIKIPRPLLERLTDTVCYAA
jgi:hypothetical protein